MVFTKSKNTGVFQLQMDKNQDFFFPENLYLYLLWTNYVANIFVTTITIDF
jgi:hypothetical protein